MSALALAVWAADNRAGLLDRTPDQNQYLFAYDQSAESPNAMLSEYIAEHPEFQEVGSRMLTAWNEGVTFTLSA